jgi:hypothetical protein
MGEAQEQNKDFPQIFYKYSSANDQSFVLVFTVAPIALIPSVLTRLPLGDTPVTPPLITAS